MSGPTVSDDDMFLSRQIQLLSHSDNVHVVAANGADDEVTVAPACCCQHRDWADCSGGAQRVYSSIGSQCETVMHAAHKNE